MAMPSANNKEWNYWLGPAAAGTAAGAAATPEWRDVCYEAFWHALVPMTCIMAGTALLYRLCRSLKKWLVPLTAADLHEQALIELNTNGGSVEQAEALLWKAMAKGQWKEQKKQQNENEKKQQKNAVKSDETKQQPVSLSSSSSLSLYEPAFLALAALYVYRLKEPEKALKLLDSKIVEKCRSIESDLEAIRSDAKAMAAGLGHMVLSQIAADEYLSLRSLPAANSSNSSRKRW